MTVAEEKPKELRVKYERKDRKYQSITYHQFTEEVERLYRYLNSHPGTNISKFTREAVTKLLDQKEGENQDENNT